MKTIIAVTLACPVMTFGQEWCNLSAKEYIQTYRVSAYTEEDAKEIVDFASRFLDGSEKGTPTVDEMRAIEAKWRKRLEDMRQ